MTCGSRRWRVAAVWSFLVFAVLLAWGAPARAAVDPASLIDEINAKQSSWVAKETPMSRLSPEERQSRLGLLIDPNFTVAPASGGRQVTVIPTSVDWSTTNNPKGQDCVSAVKNQSTCGSCWAFATTAALESQVMIKGGGEQNLAEQIVLSCSGAGSCAGGYITSASTFMQNTGTADESFSTYLAVNGTCPNNGWQAQAYRIASWQGVAQSVAAMKQALYTYGPLVTGMYVFSDFMNYGPGSGIYRKTSGVNEGGHAVVIVGYDDATQCFKVKNSWDTTWGESGFFRIGYSEVTSEVQFGMQTVAFGPAVDPAAPPPVIGLAEALDQPAWISFDTGTPAWTGQAAITHDGSDAGQSGATADSQTSYVEAIQQDFATDGTLTFWWKVSSEAGYDFLRFSVDGQVRDEISGEVNWAQRSFALAAGSHTLRWAYVKDNSVAGGQDRGWVDQVVFTPQAITYHTLTVTSQNPASGVSVSALPADKNAAAGGSTSFTLQYAAGTQVTLSAPLVAAGGNTIAGWTGCDAVQGQANSECVVTVGAARTVRANYQAPPTISVAAAVDQPGWTFFTDPGELPWTGQNLLTHDGVDAARTGALSGMQVFSFSTTRTFDADDEVSFWWFMESDSFDMAGFKIDGVGQSLYQTARWERKQFKPGAGTKTLRWEYGRFQSPVAGTPGAWVDQIEVITTPDKVLTVNTTGQDSGVSIAVNVADRDALSDGTTPFTRQYASSSAVTLTAPATSGGMSFSGWTGCTSSSGTACSVTMSGDATVTAAYTLAPPSVSLGEAVEQPTWAFTTGGSASWKGETSVTAYFGNDEAHSGAIDHGQRSWMTTSVTGPGELWFAWKASCEPYLYDPVSQVGAGDRLVFTIDGKLYYGSDINGLDVYPWISGVPTDPNFNSYEWIGFTIPAGTHTLTWAYEKDGTVADGLDGGWVDVVYWMPSLDKALDFGWSPWVTTSGNGWYGQSLFTHDNRTAAESPLLKDNESSYIQTQVTGPGTISFQWAVSSEENYDGLLFSVDGAVQGGISGEVDWTKASLPLGAGTHTLRWTYLKDPTGSAGYDGGWVDEVKWTPNVLLDTFSDGGATGDPHWTKVAGKWYVDSTKRFLSDARYTNIFLTKGSLVTPLVSGRIRSYVMLFPATTPHAAYLFAYANTARYRYVRFEGKRIVIGQVGTIGGQAAGVKATRAFTMATGRSYLMRVDLWSNGTVRVYSGTTPLLSYRFAQAAGGGVGVMSNRVRAYVDNFQVWDGSVVP